MIIPQMHLKYKILIWSSIISVAYYFISKSFGEEPQFYNFFLSYVTATTFYELFWKPIEKLVKNMQTDNF